MLKGRKFLTLKVLTNLILLKQPQKTPPSHHILVGSFDIDDLECEAFGS